MQKQETGFEGLIILQPKTYTDERGSFHESWNIDTFKKLNLNITFVQDNQSTSHRNVLRGLHFQHPPYTQGKLVRVTRGKALDVVVDLREQSKTYKKHFKIELSEKNCKCLFIPRGFAHGFLTLEDNTIVQYKCSNVYNKESEGGIIWNDPDININWGLMDEPIISDKDKNNILFKDLNSKF